MIRENTKHAAYKWGFDDFHHGLYKPPRGTLPPAALTDWRRGWQDAFYSTTNSAMKQGAEPQELQPLLDFRRRMLIRWSMMK